MSIHIVFWFTSLLYHCSIKINTILTTKEPNSVNQSVGFSYRESLSFSPHVQLKHQSEDVDRLFLPTSLARTGLTAQRQTRRESTLQTQPLLWTLDTSMRNLGLSGINSLKERAEVRLGTEQSTTNNLQLWKSSVPTEKCAQVFGITSHARPAEKTHTERNDQTQP